ncbi:hypothetical protein [Marmoricola sp. URHB0036]|uniref:hypothetical protein n=1 Tax=Marmoricola sp. URHB0036 TaxID=1298863 RepID=UPI00042012B9|nr:hypothetical protein [Marmoricola sp. URHB0036]
MLGLLAHGFHLLLLVLGLAGVLYLLFPQVQAATRSSRRTTHRPPASAQEHDQRVAELRASLLGGRLTTSGQASLAASSRVARDSSTWRGLAVGSSVAAAGGHAAVFPHHLGEAWYLGLFFLLVTLSQAAWAVLVLLDATSDRLLLAGIAGSLGLIVLWTVSRTAGLPFGLGREPVGGWDLACAVWELVVAATCFVGLRRPLLDRARVMGDLGRAAWAWTALSGATLLVLTLTVPVH